MYETPILLIVFNRSDKALRVIDVLRKIKPSFIFVAGDGPRENNNKDVINCQKTREVVLKNIDWDCEVKTLFRDNNVGCGKGPSNAITWFFENVKEGIILEDDCLPNDSFFYFCSENLKRYRDNPTISIVSGNNFQEIQPMKISSDYYYSVFPSTWGWAAWKRTWDGYDFSMSKWNTINQQKLLDFAFHEKKYQRWWKKRFDKVSAHNTKQLWDIQFYFHTMMNGQLAIIPKVNLISNIGFDADGIHCKDENNPLANLPTSELTFPLKHPVKIKRNYKADIFIQNKLFGAIEAEKNIKKLKRLIKKMIGK